MHLRFRSDRNDRDLSCESTGDVCVPRQEIDRRLSRSVILDLLRLDRAQLPESAIIIPTDTKGAIKIHAGSYKISETMQKTELRFNQINRSRNESTRVYKASAWN